MMTIRLPTVSMSMCALWATFAVACGGATPPPAAPPSPSAAPTPVAASFGEQAKLGQELYGEHCASCHGASGEGKPGKVPAVVGLKTGALPLDPPPTAKHRTTQFRTVGDVAAFAVKTMPGDNPGSLTEDQYWDILAFDLKANGIDLGEKKLDGALAATLTIPR